MDRLTAMMQFARVAEAGSFAAAATQLNVPRSVVTRQVAALEKHLGVRLLARSTRRLALTADGAAYLEKCREILDLVEAAEGGLAAERQTLRGLIRVAAPMAFGVRHLLPLLNDFLATHPEVEIEVDFNDRRTNLIEEGMDLAIRITRMLASTDVARRLSLCRLALLAAPAYLHAHGRPRHPDELKQHHCLGYTLSRQNQWTLRVDGQWRDIDIAGRLRANNGDALVDAARAGMGIVCQPTFIASTAMRSGELEVVLPEYPLPEIPIHAVYPGGRHLPHRVRVFSDFLAARIGPEPPWDAGLTLSRR